MKISAHRNHSLCFVLNFPILSYATRTAAFGFLDRKVTALPALLILLAGLLGAQNANSPGLRAAHPWNPNSPVPHAAHGPTIAAPQAQSPATLSTSDWTALGPAPIANGQRPGGGPVSGRVTGIAAD